jgi:hypothetical protein
VGVAPTGEHGEVFGQRVVWGEHLMNGGDEGEVLADGIDEESAAEHEALAGGRWEFGHDAVLHRGSETVRERSAWGGCGGNVAVPAGQQRRSR